MPRSTRRSPTKRPEHGSPPLRLPRFRSPRSPHGKEGEQILGRLVGRRIPELNKKNLDQPTLFDTHRFHAFFTTSTLDTVVADKTYRGHAVIELVNADLKNSALAHLPSGKFAANAAWLVCAVMAFNLTRAAATIAGTNLATATIRRKLVSIPARIASSARRITLHLPDQWPWETAWTALLAGPAVHQPAPPPDQPADTGATRTNSGTRRQKSPTLSPAHAQKSHPNPNQAATPGGQHQKRATLLLLERVGYPSNRALLVRPRRDRGAEREAAERCGVG